MREAMMTGIQTKFIGHDGKSGPLSKTLWSTDLPRGQGSRSTLGMLGMYLLLYLL